LGPHISPGFAMNFPKNIIKLQELTREQLSDLFSLADNIRENQEKYRHSLDGLVMAAPFYENSTRTRWSFEAAMRRLGGNVIDFAGPEGTSIMKGETLSDTIKMASGYSHVIVLRHKYDGAAELAREVSNIPVLNGGDGKNQHPTQTMLDLYTIKRELGSIEGKKVAIVGDLRYGRTTHSLLIGLSMFNAKATLVSPPTLKMHEKHKRTAEQVNPKFKYQEETSLDKALWDADVVYMTRIQKERFPDQQEYEKVKHAYVFRKEQLEKLDQKSIIMHPLPRVDEIAYEVDKDPRAAYFRQAENGLYTRMALLQKVLGEREQ